MNWCGFGSEYNSNEIDKLSVLRIRDVYPGSWFLFFTHPGSRILDSDPKTATDERSEKKFDGIPFYENTNFTKLKIILVLKLKEKIWGQFSKNYRTFFKKIVTKLSKIWVWDPGSGENLSRIQGSKRHRIPDSRSGSATLKIILFLSNVWYRDPAQILRILSLLAGSISQRYGSVYC